MWFAASVVMFFEAVDEPTEGELTAAGFGSACAQGLPAATAPI